MRLKKLLTAICLGTVVAAGILTVTARPAQAFFSSVWEILQGNEESREDTEAYQTKDTSKSWAKINGKCYNGKGQEIKGAITRGIDVSFWQGKIDWSKVAKGNVDFAFIRLGGYNKMLDSQYVNNITGANRAGVPAGVYYYSTARTVSKAIEDAQFVIEKMDGYKISYPVVVDMEDPSLQSLSRKELTQVALAFCEEIRRAGYYPMIYCNVYWYHNYLDSSMMSNVDKWIASYGDGLQRPSGNYYTIWQATDGNTANGLKPTNGLIPGIPRENAVDIDFGFKDYTKVITPRTHASASYIPSEFTGFRTENGKKYYYQNGQKVIGRFKKVGSKWYYFQKNTGEMVTNTLLSAKDLSIIYYAGSDGALLEDELYTVQGKTYYFGGTNGAASRGLVKINGKYYYFDKKTGVMLKDTFLKNSKGFSYVGPDGSRPEPGFFQVRGNTYYIYSNGYLALGWTNVKGKYYYFDKSKAYMLKDKFLYNTKGASYVGKDGARPATGVFHRGSVGYFMQADGYLKKGWHRTRSGNWYYFSGKTYNMFKNRTSVNSAGYVYRFNENGICINMK